MCKKTETRRKMTEIHHLVMVNVSSRNHLVLQLQRADRNGRCFFNANLQQTFGHCCNVCCNYNALIPVLCGTLQQLQRLFRFLLQTKRVSAVRNTATGNPLQGPYVIMPYAYSRYTVYHIFYLNICYSCYNIPFGTGISGVQLCKRLYTLQKFVTV